MADTLRIKRRATGGAAGAPASLAAAEIAYNEVDDTLYYGKGNSGGLATSIIPIAGSGAFQPKDGDLTALAGLTGTNTIYYRSGTDTWTPVTIGASMSFAGGTLNASAVATPSHGFNAHKTADQTITTDTWTKLDFGTTTYNNGSYFSTSTGRYTPPAGETCFTASVYCEGVLPGANYYLAVYKNGTIYRFATNNATNGTAQITCSDQASGTDYYEAWVFASTSGGTFSVLNGNNDATYFQGFQPMGPVGPMGPSGPPGSFVVSGTPLAGQAAEFVDATTLKGVSTYAKLASPSFSGTVQVPNAPTGTNDLTAANTAFVQAVAAAMFSTGDMKPTMKTVADPGWVMMDDGTIGDASSGASNRANADCLNLFTLLWVYTNPNWMTVAPGGRGASAAADWAAHKTITLPRVRGRVLGGSSESGASSGAGAGLTYRYLGQFIGEEGHTQSAGETGQHIHSNSLGDPTHIHYFPGDYLNQQASYVTVDGGSSYNVSLWGGYHTNTQASATGMGISNAYAGSSSPFNVIQPTTFVNFMVKL
jgi:hypothetical protein